MQGGVVTDCNIEHWSCGTGLLGDTVTGDLDTRCGFFLMVMDIVGSA